MTDTLLEKARRSDKYKALLRCALDEAFPVCPVWMDREAIAELYGEDEMKNPTLEAKDWNPEHTMADEYPIPPENCTRSPNVWDLERCRLALGLREQNALVEGDNVTQLKLALLMVARAIESAPVPTEEEYEAWAARVKEGGS